MKKNTILAIMFMIIVTLGCVGAYFYFTQEDEVVVDEPQISTDSLYTLDAYPRVDGSTATQPLGLAFKQNFTGEEIASEDYVVSKTHNAYVKLINKEVDLILVTSPSEDELKLAKDKGMELEVIPVVKEGFVFYVNSNNKVDNLTTKQIQQIYSDKITNWKTVGGKDKKILAYQRPVNSGSQTGMLSLVMKDVKIAEAPTEHIAASMADIINFVSAYDNAENAIGYSYYYYATTMFQDIDKDIADGIKLLSVDGVKPNAETIRNGSYPFTTAYYIVIDKAADENSPARKLANYMLSDRGQKVATEAGYVSVK